MKKFLKLGILIIIIIFIVICYKLSNQTSVEDKIFNVLDIDISSSVEVENSDSHGGFHGDGSTFISFLFEDDTLLEQVKNNDNWNNLPLDKNVSTLVYGTGTDTYKEGPYLSNENGEPIIPEIDNGYYCFIDRHSESTDKFDDTKVLERNSFNFTIAIYDMDNRILYYAELDT